MWHPLGMMVCMEGRGARVALETLVGIDVSVADHDELGEVSRSVARLQSFLDHAKVLVNRRTRQLAELGDRSSDHVLLDEGRLSGRDAHLTDERDRVCGTLPGFDEALASGVCTAGHVDALAQHTKDLTDAERSDLELVVDDLLAHAASDPVGVFDRTAKGIVDKIRDIHRPGSDVDELDRQRRASRVKRWTERGSGMKHTLISLDPLRDAALWNVIDHHLARLRREPSNADRPFAELQVEAVLAAVQPGDPSLRIPEVVVHADAGSLCHGRHEATLCETDDGVAVPVATAQRLCCEAILQAVVVNPHGTVDRLCAEQRTANRQQRRMLAAMYRTCAHPLCEVPFSNCRIHHVVWFTRGGRTVLANMVPLCEPHHHLVHEGGWNLTIDDRRRVTWQRPDGSVWMTDTGPDRTRTDTPSSCDRTSDQTDDARLRQPRRTVPPPVNSPPGEQLTLT
jgi:hypothetical protein